MGTLYPDGWRKRGGGRGVGWGWVGAEEREKENPIYSTHDLRIETRLSPYWSESRCWLVLQRMSARWNTSKCLCLIETTNMWRLRMDWEERRERLFFFFDFRRPCFASCFWDVPVWMHIHSSWVGCAGVRWWGTREQEQRDSTMSLLHMLFSNWINDDYTDYKNGISSSLRMCTRQFQIPDLYFIIWRCMANRM